MIRWIGNSDTWQPPADSRRARYLMPLVEEAVIAAATVGTTLRRLSLTAALNCTSRLALRVALAATDFNPDWHPFNFMPGVVKAPASCLNLGVRFLPSNEYIDRLAEVAPGLAGCGVVESFVTGEAWEQDGFVLDGRVHFFHALRQRWNESHDRILAYERGAADGLKEATERAVRVLGINHAPFCVEWRRTPDGQWKLIEAHARLGEDEGLCRLLSDRCALRVMSDVAVRAAGGLG